MFDPDGALREIKALICPLHGDLSLDELKRLHRLVQQMDSWLSDGGFLPLAWAPAGVEENQHTVLLDL